MSNLPMDQLPRRSEMLVAVKINLKDAHFLVIQVPEANVVPFIKRWADGEFKGKIIHGASIGEITYWAFNGDDVIGMHTFMAASLGAARELPKQQPTGFGPQR